ncbi:MAG TPA: GerMN domain-containing protein [Desulfosporosinus sp.]|nr:GerMN domain-containing protein [Desulfosporosinus sp.]
MFRHTFKTLFLTIVTMLLVGIFMTGCTSTKTTTVKSLGDTTTKAPETAPTPSAPVTPSDSTQQSVKLTLYFPNADASGLIATDRTVVVKDQEVIKTMFTELATPPTGLEKPLPQGTALLGATVSADGVATIDLSTDFQKNFGGGSAGEQMTMYSIVNTLTTLSNVHSVQFLLDGKKHDGILGHLDTSSPLKRNESLIIK